jgi:repressor LexA
MFKGKCAHLGQLTQRQEWILSYLNSYHQRNGFMPTFREIADDAGLASLSSVNYQLQRLHAGKIRLHQGRARAITLIN